jgi:hypothetical protein
MKFNYTIFCARFKPGGIRGLLVEGFIYFCEEKDILT